MPLINVASSLPTPLLLTSVPPPGGEPELVYSINGARHPDPPGGWGITYGVDEVVYTAYVTAHPERADFLKIVTEADIDAMIAAETDPANYGHEAGLVPPVPPVPPVNIDVPAVLQSGATLACTMGNWQGEPDSYAYQWRMNGANVGTNSPNYTVVAADVGKTATCIVTATNAFGSTAAPPSVGVTVANPFPVNTTPPFIMQSGPNITSNTGSWSNGPITSYVYQWRKDGTPVGTDAPTIAVGPDDIGKTMTCIVTALNAHGATASPPSNSVVVVDPALTET